MSRPRVAGPAVVAALAVAGGLAACAPRPGRAAGDAASRERPGAGGWVRVEPGGETTCARGGRYAFWARAADPDRLLVYFQGGGGCWSAETCRPGGEWFKDAVTAEDDPAGSAGILDLRNPANSFREWSALFVPYCTGDVHWGDNVRTYSDSLGEVRIRHKGFVNASAALEWAEERFPAAKRVAVMGCSAGSVGSILFAPYVLRRWPDALVAQVGDAETFVFDRPVDLQTDFGAHDNFPRWIPALDEIEPGEFTIERFYAAVARHHPDATFAQYTTAHDSVQIRYFEAVARTPAGERAMAPGEARPQGDGGSAGGEARSEGDGAPREPPPPGAWEAAMERSLQAIHDAAPNFRSFVAAGHEHCATPSPQLYTLEAGGVRLRDWIDALVNGDEVADVRCAPCESVPLTDGGRADGS